MLFTSGWQWALHKTLFSCIKFPRFGPLILKNLLCKTAFYANLNFKNKIELRLLPFVNIVKLSIKKNNFINNINWGGSYLIYICYIKRLYVKLNHRTSWILPAVKIVDLFCCSMMRNYYTHTNSIILPVFFVPCLNVPDKLGLLT